MEEEPGSYLFAFGAGHFIGEDDNVVDLLRKDGYKVQRILPTDQQHAIFSNTPNVSPWSLYSIFAVLLINSLLK